MDPNSFSLVARQPVMPWKFFLYFPLGLEKAAEVVFLVLLVGGFLQIISDSGAIEAGLSRLIRALGTRRMLIVPILMTVMSVLGFSGVLANAVVAFIPLGLLLSRRLGLDPVCGVAIMYVGCYSGFAPSAMCPATTLIAQQIAEVPPMSGFIVRTVVWLAILLVTVWYVMRYAAKVAANPSCSIYPTFDDELVEAGQEAPAFTARHVLTLLCLVGGFALFGWGASFREWSLRDLSAVMMAVGIIGGLVSGMKLPAITGSFITGCKHLLYSALIVGLAKSITLIMEDGRIIHTLVHYLSAPLVNLPPIFAAGGMYGMSLVVHFFITSGSGQAYVTMPIMSPIADIVGLGPADGGLGLPLRRRIHQHCHSHLRRPDVSDRHVEDPLLQVAQVWAALVRHLGLVGGGGDRLFDLVRLVMPLDSGSAQYLVNDMQQDLHALDKRADIKLHLRMVQARRQIAA